MKIVFLDMDGVMNSSDYIETGGAAISAPNVLALNELIEKSGAKVVISSAWRYMIHEGVMTIKGFSHMLLSHGIHCEIEGITVSDETLKGRGDQISQWLSVNKKLGIESYVVLDDMDLGISGKHPFVKTNPRIGLTMDDVKKALDILAVEQELNTSHEEINWSKGSKLILP